MSITEAASNVKLMTKYASSILANVAKTENKELHGLFDVDVIILRDQAVFQRLVTT